MTHRCQRNKKFIADAHGLHSVQVSARRLFISILTAAVFGGCNAPASHHPTDGKLTTLTMGVGLVTVNPQFGMQQAATFLSQEGLVVLGDNGRVKPLLAAAISYLNNGRTLRILLRPGVRFHDGTSVDAEIIRNALQNQFKNALGPLSSAIKTYRIISDTELQIDFEDSETFIADALDFAVVPPSTKRVGTGPFQVTSSSPNGVELRANPQYYLGRPNVDLIILKPFDTFRAAWADMLRGNVDMLYEIGPEGLDSLRPASNVRVFIHKRHYAYVVVLNMHDKEFQSSDIRRALNRAINRVELVKDGLQDHGRGIDSPVWPDNWAYDSSAARFDYDPAAAAAGIRRTSSSHSLEFTCTFPSAQPFERLALVLQRQLRAVGVEMRLEPLTYDQFVARLPAGNFQAILGDARLAPTIFQSFQWWYSKGSRNYGGYKSSAVDAAFDSIRHAPNEVTYKRGVAAFQQAMLNDPPAIFLAWSERARAVSTRFQVPDDFGRDIFAAIRLFKPVNDGSAAGRN